MPFKNRRLAKRTGAHPCEWCGWQSARRDAAHIIDEGPETDANALCLCPNCHRVFEEKIRPKLHVALADWMANHHRLPRSWECDNKLSVRKAIKRIAKARRP
jgi:predicted restriction endonuclease